MPVPLDMLGLSAADIYDNYRNMFWPNGQKIISAARHVARTEGLWAENTPPPRSASR